MDCYSHVNDVYIEGEALLDDLLPGNPDQLWKTNTTVCIIEYRNMSIKFRLLWLAFAWGSRKDSGRLKLPCLSYCVLSFHMLSHVLLAKNLRVQAGEYIGSVRGGSMLPAPFDILPRSPCSLPFYVFLAPCSLPYFRPCSLLRRISKDILPAPWLPLTGVQMDRHTNRIISLLCYGTKSIKIKQSKSNTTFEKECTIKH